MAVTGSQGRCVPLPPASGMAVRYKATCNTGFSLDSGTASCTVPLNASVTAVTDYLYYCSKLDLECTAFQLPRKKTGANGIAVLVSRRYGGELSTRLEPLRQALNMSMSVIAARITLNCSATCANSNANG